MLIVNFLLRVLSIVLFCVCLPLFPFQFPIHPLYATTIPSRRGATARRRAKRAPTCGGRAGCGLRSADVRVRCGVRTEDSASAALLSAPFAGNGPQGTPARRHAASCDVPARARPASSSQPALPLCHLSVDVRTEQYHHCAPTNQK